MPDRPTSAHQKAGLVSFLLLQGEKLTTREIAALTGQSPRGAWYMMDSLTLLNWPLWQDEDGRWLLVTPAVEDEYERRDGEK